MSSAESSSNAAAHREAFSKSLMASEANSCPRPYMPIIYNSDTRSGWRYTFYDPRVEMIGWDKEILKTRSPEERKEAWEHRWFTKPSGGKTSGPPEERVRAWFWPQSNETARAAGAYCWWHHGSGSHMSIVGNIQPEDGLCDEDRLACGCLYEDAIIEMFAVRQRWIGKEGLVEWEPPAMVPGKGGKLQTTDNGGRGPKEPARSLGPVYRVVIKQMLACMLGGTFTPEKLFSPRLRLQALANQIEELDIIRNANRDVGWDTVGLEKMLKDNGPLEQSKPKYKAGQRKAGTPAAKKRKTNKGKGRTTAMAMATATATDEREEGSEREEGRVLRNNTKKGKFMEKEKEDVDMYGTTPSLSEEESEKDLN